jgi:hypothetical protein
MIERSGTSISLHIGSFDRVDHQVVDGKAAVGGGR